MSKPARKRRTPSRERERVPRKHEERHDDDDRSPAHRRPHHSRYSYYDRERMRDDRREYKPTHHHRGHSRRDYDDERKGRGSFKYQRGRPALYGWADDEDDKRHSHSHRPSRKDPPRSKGRWEHDRFEVVNRTPSPNNVIPALNSRNFSLAPPLSTTDQSIKLSIIHPFN